MRTKWRLVAGAAAVLALVTACGTSGTSSPSSSGQALTPISIQLNWTPDTEFTGIYVAQAKGYYAAQGIQVNILPYSETDQDTIVSSGKSNCAVTYGGSLVQAVAAGGQETSIYAIYQHDVNRLEVLASSPYTSPAKLGGTVFGGVGDPGETIEVNDMIHAAGGTGTVKDLVVNTAMYNALYAGKVQSAFGYASWDTIQAADLGIKIRTFTPSQYGIPDMYTIVLSCNNSWLSANPDLAKKLVAATAQGYEYAEKDIIPAANILIAANKQNLTNTSLVYASAKYLAANDYANAQGEVGCQSASVFENYAKWLVSSGQLTSASGKTITTPPPASAFFSTKYGPSDCTG